MLSELNKNKLLEIFATLVQIPSPSLKEDKLIRWIQDFCKKNLINCELDDYENVYIKIAGNSSDKKPILLSAHMDVVGDSSQVNLKIDGDFIKTDGKRTLGADDKAGVACALMLAYDLVQQNEFEHGGLEIVLTRDEEHGMSGIKHADFKKLESKYVLVLDADKLGQILVSGASYTNAILKVKTNFGGHSGIDIHEEKRLNAAKMISELILDIPQGVYYKNETGTITSINLGTIIGGNIQNTVSNIIDDGVKSENYLDYFIKNSITNVINTQAQASYSIRSASVEKENELKNLISEKIKNFNQKYKELASAEIVFSQHLPPFEKSNDESIVKIHAEACDLTYVKQEVSSFHAGAETHIYAQNTNSAGDSFSPFLVGLADIFNMHSNDEKIDYKTLVKGYELLKNIFKIYCK